MKTFNNPEDGFIQSFRALRELPITLSQVNFLELVYSYTKIEGGQFYDTNENIGKYLMMSPNSAGNLVNFMADSGYITRDKIGNTNQKGWTRYITLNIDFINQKLNKVSEDIQVEIAPQIDSISLETYETEPIVVTPKQIKVVDDFILSLEEDDDCPSYAEGEAPTLDFMLEKPTKDEEEGFPPVDEMISMIRNHQNSGNVAMRSFFLKEYNDSWELDKTQHFFSEIMNA